MNDSAAPLPPTSAQLAARRKKMWRWIILLAPVLLLISLPFIIFGCDWLWIKGLKFCHSMSGN